MQLRYLSLLAAIGGALAQDRPANISICDYYTTALLTDNNSTNQYTLLTLLVNTAVIGNYTLPNVGVKVPGILAPGTYNGTEVNLLPYFDGGLASSNRGGSSGVAINFLDDGGAVPLTMNKPANGTSSNQYKLLTHLYEYFGVLLGCTAVGSTGFPAYAGSGSQYNVHKFMALDYAQMGYFITQVGLSAASFGVSTADITAAATAIATLFDYKCSPAITVVPAQGAQLQSICIAEDCPLSVNDTCSAYAAVVEPAVANATLAMGEGSNSTMAGNSTATSGSGTASSTSGATGSASGTTPASASASAFTGGAAGTSTTGYMMSAIVGVMALFFAL